MDQAARSITWDAPEHTHPDKGGDWYFALGVLTVAVVIAAIIFDNFLFAILAALSGASIAIAASLPPRVVHYGVGVRGIRIDTVLHPFSELRSYYINENNPQGPELLILGKKFFMPMIVMPLPAEYIDEIEDILAPRLEEVFMEEPIINKFLELFGF
jgi:hypothetical protein